MSLTTIVSYDGTSGDRDALGLANLFSDLGASTVLAYVRHNDVDRAAAEALLERGVGELTAGATTRVVVNPSTSAGLAALAGAERAGVIVFGSEYRTPVGRVGFQKTAQQLLDGGHTAVAIAPVGYRFGAIRQIGLIADLDDHAAIDTAHAIASHFGATVTDRVPGADLLIFGSRAEVGDGRVLLSSRNEITVEEEATAPVLVVARGMALDFPAPLYVA